MTVSQLVLPLRLNDYAVFDSFYAAGNDALIGHLRNLTEGSGDGCFLWGNPASGKTHLLQAVCERVGDRSVYLPLQHVRHAGSDVLHGLADRTFVCLDDLHVIAGDADWEFALFALLNQVNDHGGTLVVSSIAPPRESGFSLPDLESRLSRIPVFQNKELDEEGRIQALKLRARHRGLELPDDTAKFMLSRSRRDMASLYRLLDKLDTEALIAKRRLTVPFVRDVLAATDPDSSS